MPARFDPFYAMIRAHITKAGQSLVGVCADPETGSPPFIYTIGLTELDLPELLIIGSADAAGGAVLNFLADLARKRTSDGERPWADGELVSLGGKHPVKMVHADVYAKTEFTIQVGRYYHIDDGEYDVFQVVYPDPEGRYPGEPGCAEPFSLIPVFYQR